MFFTSSGVRCASLATAFTARAGAGQHVEEQRRLQASITRGSSTRTSKSNLSWRPPIPLGRLCRLAFTCRAGFYHWRRVGSVRPVDIEIRDEMQRIALEYPCWRRVSSGLDARFSITGPAPMRASMDGTIYLSFVFSET
jgi:hypothetical protein